MSKLIINIRFWYWHLQVGKYRDYKITWEMNPYLKKEGLKGRKLIEIHKFFKLGG